MLYSLLAKLGYIVVLDELLYTQIFFVDLHLATQSSWLHNYTCVCFQLKGCPEFWSASSTGKLGGAYGRLMHWNNREYECQHTMLRFYRHRLWGFLSNSYTPTIVALQHGIPRTEDCNITLPLQSINPHCSCVCPTCILSSRVIAHGADSQTYMQQFRHVSCSMVNRSRWVKVNSAVYRHNVLFCMWAGGHYSDFRLVEPGAYELPKGAYKCGSIGT